MGPAKSARCLPVIAGAMAASPGHMAASPAHLVRGKPRLGNAKIGLDPIPTGRYGFTQSLGPDARADQCRLNRRCAEARGLWLWILSSSRPRSFATASA